jgi:hypothetical protein
MFTLFTTVLSESTQGNLTLPKKTLRMPTPEVVNLLSRLPRDD